MWRAFFFAVGTMLVIVGVECLMIESATLAAEQPEAVPISNGWFQPAQTISLTQPRIWRPSESIPWSLIASGAVVILYALTLPSRWGGRGGE